MTRQDGATLVQSLDGRYQKAIEVTSTVIAGTTTLYTLDMTTNEGIFIDYVIKEDNNKRVGRIIAAWTPASVLMTDYASPTIGTLDVDFDLQTSGSSVIVNIISPVPNVYVKLLISPI